nr:O-antigen ligase family protein [Rhizobium sp. SG570]
MLIEVLALAATQSRGATVSVFIGLICLAWLFSQRKRSGRRSNVRRRRFVLIVSLMSIIAVVVAQKVIYRIGAQSVDQARLCTYASTAQAVWNNWPLGSGFGSFADVFPAYRSAQCSGIEGIWDAAHNSYLEGALGLGIVFVVVLGVALITLGWAFAIGLLERRRYHFAPAIGLASLVLVVLHSLIDFSMQIPGNAMFFAALLAGCVTISLGEKTSFEPVAEDSDQTTWTAYRS